MHSQQILERAHIHDLQHSSVFQRHSYIYANNRLKKQKAKGKARRPNGEIAIYLSEMWKRRSERRGDITVNETKRRSHALATPNQFFLYENSLP